MQTLIVVYLQEVGQDSVAIQFLGELNEWRHKRVVRQRSSCCCVTLDLSQSCFQVLLAVGVAVELSTADVEDVTDRSTDE